MGTTVSVETPRIWRFMAWEACALIELYRKQGRLDTLVPRWQSRLRGTPDNQVLREHLVDALHRAGKHEEARAIAAGNNG